MLTDPSYALVYPLVRSGGLFLAIVGIGIVAGGVAPRFRDVTLAVFGLIAAVLTTLFARQLAAPFGTPTALQVWSLIGAVLLELALIPLVVRRLRSKGSRSVTLAVLLVVGLHFLPMALAFGPLMLVLSLFVCLISVSGLLMPRLPLPTLWLLDGSAKLGVGGVMWMTGLN